MKKEWYYIGMGWGFMALAVVEVVWQNHTIEPLLCVIIALLWWILGEMVKSGRENSNA